MKRNPILRVLLPMLALLLCFSACTGEEPFVETAATCGTTETVEETDPKPEETPFFRPWVKKRENGVSIREIKIDIEGEGETVEIIQLSDLHINYFNQRDLDEANPALMSTKEHRKWLANGASIENIRRCMELFKESDQIMLTGDLIDALSWGALEKLNAEVFQKYDNVMACLGNHETSRQVEGTVADTTTLQSRLDILQENWCNDIYYSSKVIKERVMVIQMENASRVGTQSNGFWERQIELLRADLALAREKGYAVLLFYHIPLATRNPADVANKAYGVDNKTANFFSNTEMVGNVTTTNDASYEIYRMITNNGDIIKACFAGHMHEDYYTEIWAKTASGENTVIPQYVLTSLAYNTGNATRILLS